MQPAEKRKVIAIIILVALFVGASIFWQDMNNKPPKVLAEKPANIEEALARQKVMVDVSGAVAKPDVYFVTPDSRVSAVIELAGGFLAEADTGKVNMAKLCHDGMKINVPLKKVATAKSTKARPVKTQNITIININTASEEDFAKLPGVGPSLAKKIVEYRVKNGDFKTLEQLLDISGIGQAKYEQLKEYIML